MRYSNSTSPSSTAQAPRTTWSAMLEAGGAWWLILCAGVLLIAALMLRIHNDEVNEIQQSRVSLTVAELQESIETDIALGLELAENRSIQNQLEAALSADHSLHAIEVVSRSGVALFSTDRGAIGERWQPGVELAAAEGVRNDRRWSANVGGEVVTGQLLHNAFGEIVGHVSATSAAPPSRLSMSALRNAMPLWLATAMTLALLSIAAALATRLALAPQHRHLQVEQTGPLAAAEQRAASVRERLDGCQSRLDEMEAAE
ncbi:hypothetical protein [Diaphorobacter caeni]|uniref:hypothetical protein n=1 Tax=Diaphorobacter caeni TaxID=2784387 RepID=UPI001890A05E|nr:hypothetical protein [Diaphorobacter caeni]MBF5005613.1 hypothetical protein [Diaphorobacter caeni]